MVISMSLRVVLATHVHYDVARSQFFRVSGSHNLCILPGLQYVRGLQEVAWMGVNVGFPREPGKVGGVLGPVEPSKDPGRNAGSPKVSFG